MVNLRSKKNPENDEKNVKEEEKREKIAILIDFENLFDNTKDDPEQKRLGRLLDYFSFQQKKDIIVFWIFTPTHLAANAMSVVFHLYHAELVFIPHLRLCPRNLLMQIGRGLKDLDTVDQRITSQGKWLVDNTKELSEIIVVSNDFDFSELKNYAKQHGMKFQIYPSSQAFSKDYLKTYKGEEEIIDLEKGGETDE
jgi:uncharacterized LabA/DUF88 family protein